MLGRLSRLPLRRCLHTSPPRLQACIRPNRLNYMLGASGVVATYLAWRLVSSDQSIALDSPSDTTLTKQSPIVKPKPEKLEKLAPPDPKPADDAPTPVPSLKEEDVFNAGSPETDSEVKVTTEDGQEPAEEESSGGGGGAYDPVTGEINWDCPCLGGMAHGPCGPEFREAFSCFVYSEDEPKGINCVEKFQAMQNCFREHPDIYGEEIMDDDNDESGLVEEGKIDIVPEAVDAGNSTPAQKDGQIPSATTPTQVLKSNPVIAAESPSEQPSSPSS